MYNGYKRRQCHVNDLSKRICEGIMFVAVSPAGLGR